MHNNIYVRSDRTPLSRMKVNNDIKSNVWTFKTIQEYDSSFKLMKSFDIFYYLNGRFPYTNSLLWVPNGDKPDIISGEKLSLKRLYKLLCGTRLRTGFHAISCHAKSVSGWKGSNFLGYFHQIAVSTQKKKRLNQILKKLQN